VAAVTASYLAKTTSTVSSVGIATGYGLDDRGIGVRVLVESTTFTSSYSPDRLWGPSSLLSHGYGSSFRGDKAAGAWTSN
jgi:hypothetical protein